MIVEKSQLEEELQKLGFKRVNGESIAGSKHYNNRRSRRFAGRYGLVIIESDRKGNPVPTYWYDGTAPIHGEENIILALRKYSPNQS